ncbi:RDD family protein [uncultured Nocardioides sp.]|uniref:RDD family protein n=1 Tax=uncultured Nocardioides sp. TaxID=198441 RepID=UPI00260725A8|nr:RDD family protein [uncultured Nocardioides sp.]
MSTPGPGPAAGEPDFATLLRDSAPARRQYDDSELARPWRRGCALALDAVLVAGLVSALVGWAGADHELVLWLVAGSLYEVVFLVTRQATPARMLLGLRVERVGGDRLGVGVALGRHLLVALPLTLDGTGAAWVVAGAWVLLDHLWALVEKERRTLHDLVVGTVVVRT